MYPLQAHHGRRRGGEALPHPGHGEGGEDRDWDCYGLTGHGDNFLRCRVFLTRCANIILSYATTSIPFRGFVLGLVLSSGDVFQKSSSSLSNMSSAVTVTIKSFSSSEG